MSYPPPPTSYPPAPGSGAGPGHVRLRGRTPIIIGWVLLGVGIILVVVGAVVAGIKGLGKVNDFERVSIAQGGGTINLDSGKYLAYYEASDVSDSIKSVPLPTVTLTSPSGRSITLNTLYGGNPKSEGTISHKLTYEYDGHNGVAVYEFNLSEGGTYQVEIQNTLGTAPDAKMAFGTSIAKGLVIGGVMVVIGIILGVIAVILLIVGYVKRSRHKGELRAGAYWGGAAPAYGTPPGGYAAPQGYGAPQGYAPPGGYQPPPPGYAPPGGYQPPEQPNFGKEPPAGESS